MFYIFTSKERSSRLSTFLNFRQLESLYNIMDCLKTLKRKIRAPVTAYV